MCIASSFASRSSRPPRAALYISPLSPYTYVYVAPACLLQPSHPSSYPCCVCVCVVLPAYAHVCHAIVLSSACAHTPLHTEDVSACVSMYTACTCVEKGNPQRLSHRKGRLFFLLLFLCMCMCMYISFLLISLHFSSFPLILLQNRRPGFACRAYCVCLCVYVALSLRPSLARLCACYMRMFCVYLYVYLYVYMRILYTHAYIHRYVYLCCACLSAYVSLCVYARLCLFMCMRLRVVYARCDVCCVSVFFVCVCMCGLFTSAHALFVCFCVCSCCCVVRMLLRFAYVPVLFSYIYVHLCLRIRFLYVIIFMLICLCMRMPVQKDFSVLGIYIDVSAYT